MKRSVALSTSNNKDDLKMRCLFYIDSPSVAHGLRYFSTLELNLNFAVRKDKLFLPLCNTNFISKFEINEFGINVGKGTSRHFNPLED